MAVIEMEITGHITQRCSGSLGSQWTGWASAIFPVNLGLPYRTMQMFSAAFSGGTKTGVSLSFSVATPVIIYLLDVMPAAPSSVESLAIASQRIDSPSVAESVSLNGFSTTADTLYIVFYNPANAQRTLSIQTRDITATANIDDTAPTVIPVSPKNTTLLYTDALQFTWTTERPTGYPINTTQLQYSYDGSSWTDLVTLSGETASYTSTQNLHAGTIYWRGRAKTYYSNLGAWSNAVSFVRQNELTTVHAQYPNHIYINRAQALTMRWTAQNNTNVITGFDLEYDANNGQGWQTLATIRNNSETSYTVPANTLPASTSITWRVRGYNSDSVAGAWSELSFATIDALTSSHPTSPRNGISLDETQPISFWWSTSNELGSQPAGAELQWATSSSEAAYQALGTVMGPSNTFTAPANTFPGSVIYWRVRSINQSGAAGPWGNANFTTRDTPSVAVPVSPIGTIENADSAILFVWDASNDSGSAPTGADVQISYDGDVWTTLGTTDGTTRLIVPGGTINAGIVYWRVRSYNRNHYAGDWSNPVSFAAYAAPKVLGLFSDGMPFTTFTWQVDGQVAYELHVDGKSYGPYFDAGMRSFTLPEPLADGEHTASLRAQNKYALWSIWYPVSFTTQSSASVSLTLTADSGVDVALTWTGGNAQPPVITVQPCSMSTTDGLIAFSVKAEGAGLSYFWEIKRAGSAVWQSAGGSDGPVWTHEASASYDGARFRCWVTSAAGSALSDEALYRYAAPAAAPVITIQPEDTQKKIGIVRLICGATGSAYRWFRSTQQGGAEDPDAVAVTDGEGGVWRLSSGGGSGGDLTLTDGDGGIWHIPYGDGGLGTITIGDGEGAVWYLPAGSGMPVFTDLGVTTPTLSFTASAALDGYRFFCMVTNSAGSVSSEIVKYTWEDPEHQADDGDYYVFRDGALIARTPHMNFLDRVILGEHSYQVVSRLANNSAIWSNFVTATAAVEHLMIAPLDDRTAEWLPVRRWMKSDRIRKRTKKANSVSYFVSGTERPIIEVGEHEETVQTFNFVFLYTEKSRRDRFMSLFKKSVIIKETDDDITIGVITDMKESKIPNIWYSYTFDILSGDWRDFIHET